MKIVKKLIWFVIFIIVACVAVVFVYKGIIKFQFNDELKYKNARYEDKDICLTLTDDGYILDDCNGGKTNISFDSSNKCSIDYGKDYSAFIFNCGIRNINLVKLEEYNFNRISFNYKNNMYKLINKSTWSTQEGLAIIKFNFVDDRTIHFSKYLDNKLVDEEDCAYKFRSDSMGLECHKFYGYSSFVIEKYENNSVTVTNRGSKILFKLES